ncbi:uncharacterized protein PY17X_1472201 [Plasmodium yoelii]|uniref:Yir4 protein n=3 Tax=Plasmodium yoelii TaxID=5861 RepID=Q7RGS9_PLAYO|nr:uncharacterized protein PY17X_1472201 [Plasmodium yoelii]EAA16098.1 putative yir4 protein [Plasmodium yoelii yoelii]WBY61375.1 PIR protein [Plasmodium yoelii yoelii]VTZ82029.1 PIR protein [Plasmodium yoelii]|eukprot:XP_724533.1 uncharacterized protein PY17X_1472201 [Plasmodium yoelii]
MDKNLCSNFLLVTTNFPDQLDNTGKYYFKDAANFKEYCTDDSCDGDLDKINAGCLYFFNAFFGSSELFQSVANSNINIVEYIMIWLSYMLNLKDNEPSFTNLEHFYKTYIDGSDKYKKSITNVKKYRNYKDLIDRKEYYLKMDNNIASKLYNSFKLLCEMYTAFNENTSNCTNCSEKANQFVKNYEELIKDPNININSSYSKVLCTLLADYYNFKNKCNGTSSLPTIDKTKINVQCSEQISEVASSSSSITNKLFIVLSIFGVIAFFLGISYKYSLFGFRKRAQKQYLREKIKNIKKKMAH